MKYIRLTACILLFCWLTPQLGAATVLLYQTSENWQSLSSFKTFLDLCLINNRVIKDLNTLPKLAESEPESTLVIPYGSQPLSKTELTNLALFLEHGYIITYPVKDTGTPVFLYTLFPELKDAGQITGSPTAYTTFQRGFAFNEDPTKTIKEDSTKELLAGLLAELNPSYLANANSYIKTKVSEIEAIVRETLSQKPPEKEIAKQLTQSLNQLLEKALEIRDSASGQLWKLSSLKTQAEAEAELYKAASFESLNVETRGIWISSKAVPKTPEGIKAMVKAIKEAGFNVILPEVFSHGYTIYPSEIAKNYGISNQNPDFLNFDPLKVLTDEAKSQQIEIHPWFSVYYVGLNSYGPILSKYPEWMAVNKDGSLGYNRDGNHLYFASPLSEEFREYVTELMKEVAYYGVDGIHLDYVRYSGMDVPETDYSPKAVNEFFDRYGLKPNEPRTKATQLWIYYRSTGVDKLVETAAAKVREVNPQIYISAAVAPDGPPTNTVRNYLQNWPLWLERGYVDFVIPMTYSPNPLNVTGWFNQAVRKAPYFSQVFAGVSGFNLYSRLSLNNQVTQLGRTSGSLGSVFFAYDHFDAQSLKVLKAGVFSEPAVPAHRLHMEDWQSLVNFIAGKTIKLQSALNPATYQSLKESFSRLSARSEKIESFAVYKASLAELNILKTLIEKPDFTQVKTSLKTDLELLESWLEAFGHVNLDQDEVLEEISWILSKVKNEAPLSIYYLIPKHLYDTKAYDITFYNEVLNLLAYLSSDSTYRNNLSLKSLLEELASVSALLNGKWGRG